jgi:hypothetical protein
VDISAIAVVHHSTTRAKGVIAMQSNADRTNVESSIIKVISR